MNIFVTKLEFLLGKTKYILFKNPRDNIIHQKVSMENQEILRIGKGLDQETYKYLGIWIGEDLPF